MERKGQRGRGAHQMFGKVREEIPTQLLGVWVVTAKCGQGKPGSERGVSESGG